MKHRWSRTAYTKDRRALRALSEADRAAFLQKWNPGPYPATGSYMLTVMRMMNLPIAP